MGRTDRIEDGGLFSFDFTTMSNTLEDVFKRQKDYAEQVAEIEKKAMMDAVKRQSEAKRRSFIKIEEEVAKAELDGVKDTEAYRQKLRKKAIKEEYEERLKRDNARYAEELERVKKDPRYRGIKEKVSEISSKYNENAQMLRFYESLEELTDAQKKDKEQRESEQKRLNRESAQMQLTQALIDTLQGLTNSVNSTMKTYTELQKGTNARLQGKQLNPAWRVGGFLTGKNPADTFGIMESRLSAAVGVSPYFRTESMLTNLSNLINEGISSNVEQRAFLQTASENIANTFDVANSALLRIIRLQQQDSSAARLGMEAYLTRFLNSMVDNTEYLNRTFDSVQEALVEASSQMSVESSTELEYVIQKWLGALVGMGLSDQTATGLAQALGYLGSGNVEALNQSSLQNLLVMAASRGNMSYSNLLTQGLDAKSADALLNNLVAYMVEINSSGNNVVKSQFANTFGLSYSDLAAASNLAPSMSSIYGNTQSFQDMYNELGSQLLMVPLRMSMSTMIDNLWDNMQFGVGKEIASNPALAAIWKVTDLISQNTGGINIPFVNAMGFGVDLNTSVENLLKLGIVGTSSLGMIGDLISGLTTSVAPASALLKLGISSGNTTISRGTGLGTATSGLYTSASTITSIGNAGGEDIRQGALAGANDEARTNTPLNEDEEKLKNASKNIYEYLTNEVRLKEQLDTLIGFVSDIRNDVDEINGRTFGTGSKYGGSYV